MRINVTKSFLPPREDFDKYVDQIWQSDQLTNQGKLLKQFESAAATWLNVERSSFHFVTNGTVALQVALKALNIDGGEVITTPFSYVATTSAILWERCTPIYIDINPQTFCIDADKIEERITSKTRAILAVHVFGNPCDVEKIDKIAKKHNLKVIYDGAHAFGVKYNNRSLLSYGDVSMCSFHSTKLFHTIEGGAIIAKDKFISEKVELIKRFGHNADEHLTLGINAKASEFQAAMGLCNLEYIDQIIENRKQLSDIYTQELDNCVKIVNIGGDVSYNYAYFPVVFDNESTLQKVFRALEEHDVFPRRYFYPSLNKLPYVSGNQECPISEDISRRIACLPLYSDLDTEKVREIARIIKRTL